MRFVLSRFAAVIAHASILALAASSAVADGKISPLKSNTGDLNLLPLSDVPDKGRPALINGYPVSAKAFPASFYQESDDGSACTATLIGRKVLLTAAHCVGNGRKVTILLKPGSTQDGTCTHHKDYKDEKGDISADYALCLLAADVPPDRIPETLTLDEPKLRDNESVLLAGYGCTQRDATGADDKFRIGTAAIFKKLGSVRFDKPMPNYFETYSDPVAGEGAIVCPGDSGGAVYQLLDTNNSGFKNPTGRRLVIGVNSRYGLTEDDLADGRSILSATRSKGFATFAKSWSKKNKVKICGMDEVASKCRKILR